MKIILDPTEQLAQDIRSATHEHVDFALQIHIMVPGRTPAELINARLMSWTLHKATCRHETDTMETDWEIFNPAKMIAPAMYDDAGHQSV